MIMRLSEEDGTRLSRFLRQLERLPMPKHAKRAIAHVRRESASLQVNVKSSDFQIALPVIRQCHSWSHVALDKQFGWRALPKWKKVVFPVGLYHWLVNLRPHQVRKRVELNKVALTIKSLEAGSKIEAKKILQDLDNDRSQSGQSTDLGDQMAALNVPITNAELLLQKHVGSKE